jgi:hypothetical protein
MATAFDITAPTNEIPLGESLRGEIPFTVRNATGAPVRARGSVIPEDTAPRDWFAIQGEAERSFATNGVQQFTVEVAVPPGTPEGSHLFRLDVESVERPNQVFTHGPSIRLTVPASEPPPPPPPPKGYVAAVIGSVAGGVVGSLPGLIAMLAVVRENVDTVEDLFAFGIGLILATGLAVLGLWVGCVVGTGLVLRFRHHYASFPTALALAAIFPVVGGLSGLILNLTGTPGGVAGVVVIALVGLVDAALAGLAARAAIVLWKTGSL